MIYMDNAATSWPKPDMVIEAMKNYYYQAGGNPGRSGHRLSVNGARMMYECREKVAAFFNLKDSLRVIFTSGSTQAINLVLRGMLKPGDHVITTSMEHNAVMRPLRRLEKAGINIHIAECNREGELDISTIKKLIDPSVRLVVINHASNVSGTILPVEEVASISHMFGIPVLVDASQSAGSIEIDMEKMGIDLLAFTGHKELLGPTGTGGLLINNNIDVSQIEPLVCGGTGSRSEYEQQPEDLPDRYESGTANTAGIAGLSASLDWINVRGIPAVREHAEKMTIKLIEGLSDIKEVKVYGVKNAEQSVPIVSFTIKDKTVSEVGFKLDEEFGILTRVGLHCAPAAHKTLGSFPEGTVRLSPNIFNTMEDIESTIEAVREVALS
jgi:cysteine desulfurase / selenocysteine lyase